MPRHSAPRLPPPFLTHIADNKYPENSFVLSLFLPRLFSFIWVTWLTFLLVVFFFSIFFLILFCSIMFRICNWHCSCCHYVGIHNFFSISCLKPSFYVLYLVLWRCLDQTLVCIQPPLLFVLQHCVTLFVCCSCCFVSFREIFNLFIWFTMSL